MFQEQNKTWHCFLWTKVVSFDDVQCIFTFTFCLDPALSSGLEPSAVFCSYPALRTAIGTHYQCLYATLWNIFGQVAQHYSDGSDSHGTHIMITNHSTAPWIKTSVKWIIESTNWKVSFKCLPHLCNLCKIRPPLFVDFLVSLLGIECIIKTIMSLFICLFNVWPSDYRL